MKRKLRRINDPVARFWSKVCKGNPDECWEWQAARGYFGYGVFSIRSRLLPAHRYAYELVHGAIPQGWQVCHVCDNPPCVNPSHLWLGTAKANAQDMARKGRDPMHTHPENVLRGDQHPARQHPECLARGDRHGSYTHPGQLPTGDAHWARRHPEKVKRGEANNRAKMTDATVIEMRALHSQGVGTTALAGRFGIHPYTTWAIVTRRTWKHV